MLQVCPTCFPRPSLHSDCRFLAVILLTAQRHRSYYFKQISPVIPDFIHKQCRTFVGKTTSSYIAAANQAKRKTVAENNNIVWTNRGNLLTLGCCAAQQRSQLELDWALWWEAATFITPINFQRVKLTQQLLDRCSLHSAAGWNETSSRLRDLKKFLFLFVNHGVDTHRLHLAWEQNLC